MAGAAIARWSCNRQLAFRIGTPAWCRPRQRGTTKKSIVFRLLCLLLVLSLGVEADTADQRIRSLLKRTWEQKRIAAGDNGPVLDLDQNSRADLLVLLHHGVSLAALQQHYGWSTLELARRLAELKQAGLLLEPGPGHYRPGILVMTTEETASHFPVDATLVNRAADLVVRELPKIGEAYRALSDADAVEFSRATLFLLSNVALDNWQIRNVEQRVLRAERPQRGGSRFYFSLQEDAPDDGLEAFGIFGNHTGRYGPYVVGVYGNRRNANAANFLLLSSATAAQIMGLEVVQPDPRQALIAGYVAKEPQFASTFERLGWTRDGERQALVLRRQDLHHLERIAGLLTEDYVKLLEGSLPVLRATYENSPYRNEVSFEEYFIWWYHLFYSAVTERLHQTGHIEMPEQGITTYIVDPR